MTAKTMAWYLAVRNSSPFYVRKQLAVVPNVSWGLLNWEADLIVCSKAGYLTEIETKISMADWKADLAKAKFGMPQFNEYIRRFYYCAPAQLASRFEEVGIPTWAGVIAIDGRGHIDLLRQPENTHARKLRDKEILQLLRLGSMKAWKMAHDPEFDRFPSELHKIGESDEEV